MAIFWRRRRRGALFIDSSTIDVEGARQAHAMARDAGMLSLDAPVSGGTGGAAAGTLTFMAGGTEAAFAAAQPALSAMGRKLVHCGGAGAGQAAKICNNMILGISMIAVSEAFVLGEKLGLSHQALFDVASTSSGQCWALTTNCPVPGPVPTSPANRDYRAGFATALMLKDLKLAQQAAQSAGAATALGRRAAEIYARRSTAPARAATGLLRDHQRDPGRCRMNRFETILTRDAGSRRACHAEPSESVERVEPAGHGRGRDGTAKHTTHDPAIGCIVLAGSESELSPPARTSRRCSRNPLHDMYAADWFGGWDAVGRVRTPIIAAVSGFALGGGCELAMMCDFILASDTAKFGQPEIKLGVIPGMGGSQRLTRAVGKAKAMEMCLTGRMMDAAEAERSGLVARIVPAACAARRCTQDGGHHRFGMSLPVAIMAKEAVNRAFEGQPVGGHPFRKASCSTRHLP